VPTEGDDHDGGPGPRRRRLVAIAIAGVVLAATAVAGVAIAAGDGTGRPEDDAGDEATTGGAGPDQDLGHDIDIAVVGDSLIEQSRDQMQAHADDQDLSVVSFAFGGSAPCDWMDTFHRLAEVRPRQLVISFAGNDSTECVNPGGGPPRDPETIADAYRRMMPDIVDLFDGTEVFVAVPPPVGEPASEPAAAAIRRTYRDLAGDRPEITLVDPAPRLGPDGEFHLALPCEPWESAVCDDDGTVAVREPDGIHLTPAGGERYARSLLDALGHPVDS
jgi:hypothetical protein